MRQGTRTCRCVCPQEQINLFAGKRRGKGGGVREGEREGEGGRERGGRGKGEREREGRREGKERRETKEKGIIR